MKTVIAIIASFPATVAVELLSYVYQDWEFAKWIAIAIGIDTFASIVKHYMHKDVSSEEFWHKFSKKIFVYLVLLILSNALSHYSVQGHSVGATEWISEYLCVYMMIRETISILENINAIMPIIPKWLIARLKDFNENGEYIGKKRKS